MPISQQQQSLPRQNKPSLYLKKLQEQYLALQLEQRESKEWILENYLNTINFGGGTWGVKTAALRYFGKEVSDLTLSECAVLAAIPKSPSGYDPLNYPETNRDRRMLVLNKLLERGSLSATTVVTNVQDFITHVAQGLGLM